MNKKPMKLEEPAGVYHVKPTKAPARADGRVADLETVRKNNGRLMQVHAKVLQKLAQ